MVSVNRFPFGHRGGLTAALKVKFPNGTGEARRPSPPRASGLTSTARGGGCNPPGEAPGD